MNSFIPIELYTPFYFYSLLFIVLVTFLHTLILPLNSVKILKYIKVIGPVLLIFVILYMGLRPISGRYFGDMSTYSHYFKIYSTGAPITSTRDILFHNFTKFSSQLMTIHVYFLLCAGLYVIPLYFICKKWFNDYWFYGFLFLIGAFSFWAYGTNGIRNGIAGSFFLLGISREKRVWQILWIVLAINFHKTMLLPAVGFLLANFYNQPKRMIVFWALCIPVSLIGGGFFENFFGSIGFDDQRIHYFTEGKINNDDFRFTGFRWDFLMYSATAVFAGWYYIVKLKFKDKIYFWLYNTYLFSNAFWILVIRANFSNRFAYLSWFMIGVVLIYPLLIKEIIPRQHHRIGLVLIAYFSFTFIMNLLIN
ncbi:EpsG family protein [Aequorivita sp. SDUM287046]|uniref:EpsG family protein n=1 Tax=Aequorivita aurantiaca TaxID=3053356 RepID=A0ABT8DIZ4_9FLAO|nr:EpsG family protein [Aequorivita aurantiaca]MDN3723964.1 EpsG family protein [Aequorivita aurantiaca]